MKLKCWGIVPLISISVALVMGLFQICQADTAEVLPKGVFNVEVQYYHYFDINKRYDPDGDSEDLAVDFNRNLTSEVFPALAPLNPFVGGTASVGTSDVDFTLKYRWSEFKVNYGITDKFSVGILIPYFYSKNKVSARLDPSTANVGKNPVYGTPMDPLKSPLIPLALGGVPLTTDDVQNLLGKGLDVNNDGVVDIPGYGYKKVKTWSDSGFSDIEVKGRYQFFKNEAWRLAFTGGVRLPTGDVDDPDNLQDVAFGDGTTDLLFRLHTDYIGLKNFLLDVTLRYDVQLPDKQKLRVPDDVSRPITLNKETVDRNLGDIFEFEIFGNYAFSKRFSGGLKYRYTKKQEDNVDGDKGFAYSSLEEETGLTGHMIFVLLGYSTLQSYLEKKTAVPFYVNLEYRNRFAGSNNATKSQYLSLICGIYL